MQKRKKKELVYCNKGVGGDDTIMCCGCPKRKGTEGVNHLRISRVQSWRVSNYCKKRGEEIDMFVVIPREEKVRDKTSVPIEVVSTAGFYKRDYSEYNY